MTSAFYEQLNQWGQQGVPFLFVIDFEEQKPRAWKLEDVNPDEVLYNFNGVTNAVSGDGIIELTLKVASPVPFTEYKAKFDAVMNRLLRGDSFLANLTIKTEVTIQGTLMDYFHASQAPYRLWMKDKLVVFSPESFVRLENGILYSYPMKGTIDSSINNARERILGDTKEMAEHVTIVDLLRNDLSVVAQDVRVRRFRYIQEVRTSHGNLLQVSSEIAGTLRPEYDGKIGDLIKCLLPAGSVSGAPKRKTCEIIQAVEGEPRGYYTGVCGIFDGTHLDSGVMIRFIEQAAGKYYYRSGGGITTQSIPAQEFEEVLKKIYVPVN